MISSLHILGHPPKSLSVSLPHDNTAHEYLNGPYPFAWHLALSSGLVQSKLHPQFIFRDGLRVIDLVSKDKERDFGELFHGQQSVELSLRFGKTLMVFGVNKEDNPVYLGEVVFPETTGLLMSTKVEGGELAVTDS